VVEAKDRLCKKANGTVFEVCVGIINHWKLTNNFVDNHEFLVSTIEGTFITRENKITNNITGIWPMTIQGNCSLISLNIFKKVNLGN